VTSRNIDGYEKGIHVSFLKVRWHGLLSVLKQFLTCEGHYGVVFLYHLWLLIHFIGFHLNVPFYLLRILYKMSKRYKKHSLDSSFFHHSLIKILVTHHLKTIGNCWDGVLVRNGFVSTIGPNSDELLVKQHLDSPNNKTTTKPLNEVMPSQFPHEKHVVDCEWSEPPVHNLDNGHNANMKPYVDKSHKKSKQKHTTLGFQKKRDG
jgi:hypothetical protein